MPGGKNDSMLSRFSSKASLLSSRALQVRFKTLMIFKNSYFEIQVRITRWNRGKDDDLFMEVKVRVAVFVLLPGVRDGKQRGYSHGSYRCSRFRREMGIDTLASLFVDSGSGGNRGYI